MDTTRAEEIYNLFDQILEAWHNLQIMRRLEDEIRKQRPARPEVVKDLAEWQTYQDQETRFKKQYEIACNALQEANAHCQQVEISAVHTLPEGVWFEYGDHAIGISFVTNWPQSRAVQIQPRRPDSNYGTLNLTD